MTPAPVRRLDVLADGTVRQQSPVTGTVVWTVPGRSHRPLRPTVGSVGPLPASGRSATCSFCRDRYLETPPEKARLVRRRAGGGTTRSDMDPGQHAEDVTGSGDQAPGDSARTTGEPGHTSDRRTRLPGWDLVRGLSAEQVTAEPADVRRIPNLFEILPWSYWDANYEAQVPADVVRRARAYLASPAGDAHVRAILDARLAAAGEHVGPAPPAGRDDLLQRSLPLFAGMHDLIVPRRHFVDGAARADELCSAGDLDPDEHHAFLRLSVDTVSELAAAHPAVRYVAAFQNWLAAAGATLDHLHKQVVAIDEHGPLMSRVVTTLRRHPDLFNTHVAEPAVAEGLVIAGNRHAIALAGVGHRYPTIELYSTGAVNLPWEHDEASVRGISDLLHACHAATGRLVPTNEEWHYRPRDVDVAMPWRINLKWRVSTLAGFEGGTKINVNTISPWQLRERIVVALTALRAQGKVAEISIGDEHVPGGTLLRYRER